ncbi:MAG: hypothetical protein RIC55_35280 [Pirellulaceae bacterium]
MKSLRLLLPLLLVTASLCGPLLCTSAQASLWEKHCRKKCGPVDWRWKLPPGNGHYIAPNPCLGPPAYYTPQLPLYYRGPVLRTIDVPLE